MEFLRVSTNSRRIALGLEELDTFSFEDHLQQRLQLVQMDPSFLDRSLNEGFSGGEKKRNEILDKIGKYRRRKVQEVSFFEASGSNQA